LALRTRLRFGPGLRLGLPSGASAQDGDGQQEGSGYPDDREQGEIDADRSDRREDVGGVIPEADEARARTAPAAVRARERAPGRAIRDRGPVRDLVRGFQREPV